LLSTVPRGKNTSRGGSRLKRCWEFEVERKGRKGSIEVRYIKRVEKKDGVEEVLKRCGEVLELEKVKVRRRSPTWQEPQI
jgi:predicted secreted protein